MSDKANLKKKANKTTPQPEKAQETAKTELTEYIVKNGDTRPSIAKKVGLHVVTLTRLNKHVTDWKNLKAGTKLNIVP